MRYKGQDAAWSLGVLLALRDIFLSRHLTPLHTQPSSN